MRASSAGGTGYRLPNADARAALRDDLLAAHAREPMGQVSDAVAQWLDGLALTAGLAPLARERTLADAAYLAAELAGDGSNTLELLRRLLKRMPTEAECPAGLASVVREAGASHPNAPAMFELPDRPTVLEALLTVTQIVIAPRYALPKQPPELRDIDDPFAL
jgi:hypothetical protein